MPGIYIHIPFCRSACHYCNFHFTVSKRSRDAYVSALCAEIVAKSATFKSALPALRAPITSVYFGGGTPSVLDETQLNRITETLFKHFEMGSGFEFTLEANPDDVSPASLQLWHQLGINRLSIGLQSFDAAALAYLGRLHNVGMAVQAIKMAQNFGFTNINGDLIYGVPGLSPAAWNNTLDTFFSLNIPHLSAYCLTVEPHTPLNILIDKGKKAPVNDSEALSHYRSLLKKARRHGFLHYEISNFSRAGFLSKHNTAYWQGEPYLGLGASAHSYYGGMRLWNVASVSEYIKALEGSTPFTTSETLTPQNALNEYIMTGLRTMWGIDLAHIEAHFGETVYKNILRYHKTHPGRLKIRQKHMLLTASGKLFADRIASDLFEI